MIQPLYNQTLLTCIFVLHFFFCYGQNTIIEGVVYEDSTKTPIAFAKVHFMGTQNGTTTDFNGDFSLSAQKNEIAYDTLIISLLGFKTQKIAFKNGEKQKIDIQLMSSLFQNIDEVTAVAGENPAWPFMRKLIANKTANNPENLNSYSSKEYSKIRFDMNHFTEKFKKNILVKPFDYIWDNAQITEDGVNYLPILLTEKVIEHNYQSSPKDKKDIVIGEKTTGLAGPKLKEFTNDLYITPNIYDNYITILGKSFPSPLNDNYKNNYKFYLMDSTGTGDLKTYKIRFKPKYQRQLAFNGEMTFDSTSFAIKSINLRFDVKANVNFVRSYIVTQIYDKVESGNWMLVESQVIGDFTVMENASDMTGFFGRKRAFHSDYSINQTIDAAVFNGIELISYQDSSEYRNSDFWTEQRSESFSNEETKLITITKRVESDPAFKIRKNIFYTIGTGFIPLKGVQIGNIYTFYSFNSIEASRVKFGLRSDPRNLFPMHFSSYLAYGTKDKQWKYELGSFINLTKKGATRLGATYRYDIEQLGRSFNQIALDHVIGSLSQLGQSTSRNYAETFEAYFEKSFAPGVISRITYFNKTFSPTGTNKYMVYDESDQLQFQTQHHTAGFKAVFKFSYLYKDITGTFYDKKDLYKVNRKFPDIALKYEYSSKGLFASDFDYQKIKLSIRQRLNTKKLGHLNYNLELGQTFGNVPHLLLDLPFGNQLIFADRYAFNLMNFMEFASDQYLTVHLSQHFEGLILDRIPLINKLKWRSYVFGKSFFGNLSAKNNQERFVFPVDLSPIKKAYHEVGFGIENIFKFASIDFVWRLTPGIGEYYTFLVKPSFKFSF